MSLQTQIYSLVQRVTEKFIGVDARMGRLDQLDTANKSSLVTALNEVAAKVTAGGSGGGTASTVYTHAQVVAAAIWTINHNLGLRPAVSILDSGGNEVEADVVHTSANQLLIRFAIPISGLARLT